jgi:hypothetical protein
MTDFLQKDFPRGDIGSNYLKIPRAGTINYDLLLKYFSCALAKEHDVFFAGIVLPADLKGKIPSWYINRHGKEFFVDSTSGPFGHDIHENDVFVIKFNFFVNERNIQKIPDIKDSSVEQMLVGELTEIRHSLIEGNQEPLEVLREFYQEGEILSTPKFLTSKHFAEILDFPH